MGWISILELNCDVIDRERLLGQLNIIFIDKTALRSSSALPWPDCCPSAAVCCLLDGGNAIVFWTLCISDPWYNPEQKEKHQEKKGFVLGFFLFVCLLFSTDLPNLVHEMIPQAVVLAHLNKCGSRHKGLKGGGGRAAHFATKEHIPWN